MREDKRIGSKRREEERLPHKTRLKHLIQHIYSDLNETIYMYIIRHKDQLISESIRHNHIEKITNCTRRKEKENRLASRYIRWLVHKIA